MKTRRDALTPISDEITLEKAPDQVANGHARLGIDFESMANAPTEPTKDLITKRPKHKSHNARGAASRRSLASLDYNPEPTTKLPVPVRSKALDISKRKLTPRADKSSWLAYGDYAVVSEHNATENKISEENYLKSNPDVAYAVESGVFKSGLEHWQLYGREEAARGLRQRYAGEYFTTPDPASGEPSGGAEVSSDVCHPEAQTKTKEPGRNSDLDVDVSAPPDTRQAVAQMTMRHQDQFDAVGDVFFEELYLELNRDVAEAVDAGQIESGCQHWRLFGKGETRYGTRAKNKYIAPARAFNQIIHEAEEIDRDFDSVAYYALYPDVLRNTDGSAHAALDHWTRFGRLEGRHAPGLRRPRLRHIDYNKLFQRPFGINVYGPFAAASGLGTVARAMAKAIKCAGIPFELWEYAVDGQDVKRASHHQGRVPRYRINLLLANADLTSRLFAAYPEEHFSDAYNISLWQWELAGFRADWFMAFDGLDEVWTNSKFQQNAIGSIAPVPVTTIPIPVAPSAYPALADRDRFGIPNDAFVFFMSFDVGSTSSRKNPFAAIEAFRTVSATNPSAHLVLKYHSPSHERDFTRRLATAMRGVSGFTLITETLLAEEMNILRASCDCLVAPHRSEGFGLNIAEFMSIGKPVIATAYSGNLDFFDESVGFSIDYGLTAIEDPTGPYRAGCVWAEPIMASLIEKMQFVLTNQDIAAARGQAARRRIGDLLSLERVGQSVVARLDMLGLSAEPPPFMGLLAGGDSGVRSALQHESTLAQAMLISRLAYRPVMSILMPVYNVPAVYLQQCVESVLQQTYPFWELCICNDASTAADTIGVLDRLRGRSPKILILDLDTNVGIADATNRALEMSSGEFVVLLDNDDLLTPVALEEVVQELGSKPDLDVLYSDEDKIDPNGHRIDHFYKPDWSPEHLESVMYVLHMLVIRKRLLLKLGGLRKAFDGAQDYDLMLRCSRATDKIHHIPKVLYHWRSIPGSSASVVDAKPSALQNGMRALADHAQLKYGGAARVEQGLSAGTFRLRRNIAAIDIPVTLLILTGNAQINLPGRGMISMVDNFVDSIRSKTRHRNYQITVVDNDTLTPEQILRFNQMSVRVENMVFKDGFNFSEKANFAISKSRTENVVLLNDDMEIIREDWLEALLDISHDGEIGAVGARLLHADGTIQHAGIVMGVHEGAAHIYHSYPGDFIGYNAFTHIIRNYSAVTAACLATRKSVVAQIGGFDEGFPVDFNDVDFCLRLVEAGFRVAYTPYAELYHYENSSIKRERQNPSEMARFRSRWNRYLESDPHYNINLTRNTLDFAEHAIFDGPRFDIL